MATFWYPAQLKAGQLPAPYVDPKQAVHTDSNWGWPSSVLPYFVSYAFPDAPIATNAWTVLVRPSIRLGQQSDRMDHSQLQASLFGAVDELQQAARIGGRHRCRVGGLNVP